MIAPMPVPVTHLDWSCTPLEAAAAWPQDSPLVMLHSERPQAGRSRWSILASPRAVLRLGEPPGGDPLSELRRLEADSGGGRRAGSPGLPFAGGWIGYLAYELGRILEPAAAAGRPGGALRADDRSWPLGELCWCQDAAIYDHLAGEWYAVGGPPALAATPARGSFSSGALSSSVDPDAYLSAVARTVEYIAAGDVFQVNIARRLSAPFAGSSRALALRALEMSGAWYGAYLELPSGRAIVSMSPELFLQLDGATGRVLTRPVKGTRPGTDPAAALLDSPKDAAELAMIVDLMRNDLGRVCAFGSVRVPRGRIIETHPTVHHGVGEVTGLLRPGVSRSDLLAATFPAGSVTGAPKIRAMQIIEELETVCRGPYCGAIGYLSRCGGMCLNVAIRTIALSGTRPGGSWSRLEGILDYGTGAGIVADSDPAAEYRETAVKAAVLRNTLKQTCAVTDLRAARAAPSAGS